MDDLVTTAEHAMMAMKGTDTGAVRAATTYLKALMNKKSSSPVFFLLVQNSTEPVVRQLAGVLLRRKVVQFWSQLPSEQKTSLQEALLTKLATEPQRVVRKAIITNVAALSKPLLLQGGWPQLMDALVACSAHDSEDARELGMILLREITYMIGVKVIRIIDAIKPLMGAALADASKRVQSAGLRCIAAVMSCLQGEENDMLEVLGDMLPAMVSVCEDMMSRHTGVEEAVIDAMDCIRHLVEAESPLVQPHIVPLARFFLTVLANDHLEPGTRSEASEALISLITQKPRTFYKKGLLDATLPVVMGMIAQYDAEEERDVVREARSKGVMAMDFVDNSLWNMAGRVLDVVAQELPAKHVFAKLGEHVVPWLQDAEPAKRAAALTALGVCAEGCVAMYSEHLEAILGMVLTPAMDTTQPPIIRDTALMAMAELCEFVQPRITSMHATVIPGILRVTEIDSTNLLVLERACMALELYLDALDQDVLGAYVPQLMERLGEMLASSAAAAAAAAAATHAAADAAGTAVPTGSTASDLGAYTAERVVAAISSVAVAAGHYMLPFVESLMIKLGEFCAMTDAALLRLRGEAIECVGYVAIAAGKDIFRPYLEGVMGILVASLEIDPDLHELKEATYLCLMSLAEAFGEELAPHLPGIVTAVQAAIDEPDVIEVVANDDEAGGIADALDRLEGEEDEEKEAAGGDGTGTSGAAGGDGEDGEEDGEEIDDEEEGNRPERLRAQTSQIDMKCAAVSCLAFLAQHCPISFAPHIADAIETFSDLLYYHAQEVTKRSITGLVNCVAAMLATRPLIAPAAGDTTGIPSVPEEVRGPFNDILTMLILIMKNWDVRSVVGTACIAVQQLCKKMGAAAVVSHHKALMTQLLKIGREKARCQLVLDDGEGGVIGHRNTAADELDKPGSSAATLFAAGAAALRGEASVSETAAAIAAGDDAGDDEPSHGGHAAGLGEDEMEHDTQVIDEATDAVVAIAAAMGEHFTELYLHKTVTTWLRYLQPERPIMDQLMAIGLFSDLAKSQGAGMAPFVPQIVPILIAGATSGSREMQRNCIFGIGTFIENVTAACGPYLAQMLTALQPPFATVTRSTVEDDFLLDNACSALCRAMMAVPGSVPLSLAMPALASALPVRMDHDEHLPVFTCLAKLLEAQEPELLKVLPTLAPAFGVAYAPRTRVNETVVTTVVTPSLRHFLHTASADVTAPFVAAIETLPAEQAEAMRAALS